MSAAITVATNQLLEQRRTKMEKLAGEMPFILDGSCDVVKIVPQPSDMKKGHESLLVYQDRKNRTVRCVANFQRLATVQDLDDGKRLNWLWCHAVGDSPVQGPTAPARVFEDVIHFLNWESFNIDNRRGIILVLAHCQQEYGLDLILRSNFHRGQDDEMVGLSNMRQCEIPVASDDSLVADVLAAIYDK
jgi:hypothetical protein